MKHLRGFSKLAAGSVEDPIVLESDDEDVPQMKVVQPVKTNGGRREIVGRKRSWAESDAQIEYHIAKAEGVKEQYEREDLLQECFSFWSGRTLSNQCPICERSIVAEQREGHFIQNHYDLFYDNRDGWTDCEAVGWMYVTLGRSTETEQRRCLHCDSMCIGPVGLLRHIEKVHALKFLQMCYEYREKYSRSGVEGDVTEILERYGRESRDEPTRKRVRCVDNEDNWYTEEEGRLSDEDLKPEWRGRDGPYGDIMYYRHDLTEEELKRAKFLYPLNEHGVAMYRDY